MKHLRKETLAVHGIHRIHTVSMDLVAPIHMSSTFRFRNSDHGTGVFEGSEQGYIYSRMSNPTVDLFQEKMALLEEGESALATASGMAAISSVALTLAKPGDNFVACSTLYGGTFALFGRHLDDFHISSRLLSPSECCDEGLLRSRIDTNTRFLFAETPSNPTLDIIDIALWGRVAHDSHIPLVVDNTFASPYLQNPLLLGADIVVHSATKYLCGHGDAVGGVIVGKQGDIDTIRNSHVRHFGPILSPFNAWLFMRGLKTLALRMEKHSDNAMAIAHYLENHPKVLRAYYPGLSSHPGHETAKKQMKKFGGMIAFEIRGGIDSGKRLMDSLQLCILAVSLGDCETLIQHPASMTHSTYSAQERKIAGISDGLIRLSVGIEAAGDIIADIDQALKHIGD
jgi:methionine-gamma-lyase